MDGLLAKLAFAAVIVAQFLAAIVLISRRADIYATPSKPLRQKAQGASTLRHQAARHHPMAQTDAIRMRSIRRSQLTRS